MMRKILFVCVFLGVLSAGARCWAADFAAPGPKAYIAERVFEFRPVVEWTEIVHEFTLGNRGDAPLEILKIDSG